jgi:PleD family two-component response regulator
MRRRTPVAHSLTRDHARPSGYQHAELRLIEGGARGSLALARREQPGDRTPLKLVPEKDMATVLIGDADENVISMLRFALGEDFDLFRATDGEQALRLALVERPDLVVLDAHMPKLDGYRVTTQIRRNAATANTPVILLDSQPERIDVLRGFAAGANDYITKPFDPNELRARIKETLELDEIV